MASLKPQQKLTIYYLIVIGGFSTILYCYYNFIADQFLWTIIKENDAFGKSFCSSKATERGLGQNVISFCHFLNPKNSSLSEDSEYFKGIMNNVNRAKQFYPGWLVRIYTYSHPDFDNFLLNLTTTDPDVFVCDIENIPSIGNISHVVDAAMWRFLPMLDPTVDIFISRDLDSGFSPRELVAVTEWLLSNKTFHTMKDHPFHAGPPIFAGMWGAKNAKINSSTKFNFQNLILEFGTVNGTYFQRGYDQEFLRARIYPIIKNDLLSHDSYFCGGNPDAVPFPVQRRNNTDFVGNYAFSPNRYPITNKCPIACRPTYGKDWEFC